MGKIKTPSTPTTPSSCLLSSSLLLVCCSSFFSWWWKRNNVRVSEDPFLNRKCSASGCARLTGVHVWPQVWAVWLRTNNKLIWDDVKSLHFYCRSIKRLHLIRVPTILIISVCLSIVTENVTNVKHVCSFFTQTRSYFFSVAPVDFFFSGISVSRPFSSLCRPDVSRFCPFFCTLPFFFIMNRGVVQMVLLLGGFLSSLRFTLLKWENSQTMNI